MADQHRIIDLDAAKTARAEALGEAPIVRWKGEDHQLPPELPARFLELILGDQYEEALDRIFEPGFAARFLDEDGASVDDLTSLAEGIAAAYGFEGGLGNLSASGSSSSNTSPR